MFPSKKRSASDSSSSMCSTSNQKIHSPDLAEDVNLESLDDSVEKNRERNREHAKRTRLRKKVMLEGMKERLLFLQNQNASLEQLIEESRTANILLGLSVTENNPMKQVDLSNKSSISGEDSDYLLNLDLGVDESKGNITKGKRIGSRNNKIFSIRDGDGSALTPLGSSGSLAVTKGANIVEQLRYRVRLEAAQKNLSLPSPSGSSVAGVGKEKSDSLSVTSSASSSSRAGEGEGGGDREKEFFPPESQAGASTAHDSSSRNFHRRVRRCPADDPPDEEDLDNTAEVTPACQKRNRDRPEEEEDDDDDHGVSSGLDDKETKWDSDTQKKERNKMHARQTRNRKKMFTSKMQETIQLLERKNLLMHFQLQGLLRNLSGIPTDSNASSMVLQPLPLSPIFASATPQACQSNVC
eukprot:gene24767-33244_t